MKRINVLAIVAYLFTSTLWGENLVGSLGGELNVTNTGAATYSLPISVIDGVAGMAPNLSIDYDSTSGNGLLGKGFTIGGLSSITRMATSMDVDGYHDGIDFDDNDRFALDGQRLVCISGTYGLDNSEYATEIDSFVKVTAYGQSQSGPKYFVVQTKEGLTKYYGQTNASSLVFNTSGHPDKGAKLTWLLDKIEDSSGNSITFTYSQDPSSELRYISGIQYGSASHRLGVVFVTEARADKIPHYVSGTDFSLSRRLRAIQVTNGGIISHQYVLEYTNAPLPEVSKLEAIEYRDFSTGKTMATSFEWQENTRSKTFQPREKWYTFQSEAEAYIQNRSDAGHIYADLIDMDGDGLLDRVYKDHPTLGGGIYVARNISSLNSSNGNGFAAAERWFYSSSKDEQNRLVWTNDSNICSMMVDVNGDGLIDKIDHCDYANGLDYGLWVSLNTGNGFSQKSKWLSYAEGQYAYPRITDGFQIYGDLIDMNGDGLVDRVSHYNPTASGNKYGMWVYLNQGNHFGAAQRWFTCENEAPEQARIEWVSDSDTLSKLIDINGDGLPDKLDHRNYAVDNGYGIWVSVNNGSGFEPMKLWLATSDGSESDIQHRSGGSSIRRDLVDMNGDGLVDRVVYSYGGSEGLWVHLNTGNGFENTPKLWFKSDRSEQNFVEWVLDSDVVSRLVDMNGDGLVDKVNHCKYSTTNGDDYGIWVSINNGSGFNQMQKWLNTGLNSESDLKEVNGNNTRRDLVDINGDGLLDRVSYYNNSSSSNEYGLWVNLNKGDGFESNARRWLYSSFDEQNYPLWVSNSSTRSKLVDINGDGLLDKIDHRNYENSNDFGLHVSLNANKPAAITKITSSMGVETKIVYSPLTDLTIYSQIEHDALPPIVSMPTKMLAVSAVLKDSGTLNSAGEKIFYETSYTYSDAKFHTRGRGFLGFRIFLSRDEVTGLARTEMVRHDFPYTGMVISSSTEHWATGQILSRTENTLDAKVLNGGKTLFPYFKKSEEWKAEFNPGVTIYHEPQSEILEYMEANAYGHTTTTNDFDSHGNNIKIVMDFGDGYKQTTVNQYAYDDVSKWYIGRLSKATVTSVAPDTTDQNETIVRSSSFTYDTKGLLHTETVESGNALAVTTTYTRDNQGRVIKTTVDPADGSAIITSESSNLDPSGRFYLTSENAYGHASHVTYDKYGRLATATDPNGLTTSYEYDELGRVTREDRPDGTWTTTSYTHDTSVTVSGSGTSSYIRSAYKVTINSSAAPQSVTWYDAQARPIRTASQDFDGNWVYQDTYYNEKGQTVSVSENYYWGDSKRWTTTLYDELGRSYLATAPDGTQMKTVYNGRTTTTINNYVEGSSDKDKNQTTVTILNAKGKAASVTSYNDANQALVLQYRYDGVGNILETEDSEGNVTKMVYDKLGNQIELHDPSMGIWEYAYNALGQLTETEDAIGNTTTKTYDDLGRVTQEVVDTVDSTIPTLTRDFYYDGVGGANYRKYGALYLEKSSDGFRRMHYYDDLNREFLTVQKIEGRWFYQQTDFDQYSRPIRLTHYWRPPSLDDALKTHYRAWYSHSQETVYNSRSFVTEVRDSNGKTWWSDPEYNVDGQLVSYLAGNGLKTTNVYDADSQLLERIYVKNGSTTVFDHSYTINKVGNLTRRTDNKNGLGETFTFDRLNRMRSSKVDGENAVWSSYDDLGNIQSRGGVGSYSYTGSSPFRVTSAGGRSFLYDANGAITQVTGSSTGEIKWAGFHKPLHMEVADKRSTFGYDSGNNRVTQTRQEYDQGTWLDKTRKTYVGALFEQEHQWNYDHATPKWDISYTRIYISTPAGVIGSWVKKADLDLPEENYFHRDHLGSVIAITDKDRTISKEFSYDAWGRARDASDWAGFINAERDSATDRGFTGHEMLDGLGLIHMNGRIYDPILGRFLSADPNIQSPSNLQNYNRYSYVLNNPISMTDPSGFFFKKLFKKIKSFVKTYWKTIVSTVLSAFLGPIAVALFQITVSAIEGGLKGALITTASIALTMGIAQGAGPKESLFVNPAKEVVRATAHGVTQGGIAELSGGDFGDGFVSGFSGSIAGSLMKGSSIDGAGSDKLIARTAVAAVAGGMAAEITGGSFINGAHTAAFVHLLNNEASRQIQRMKLEALEEKIRHGLSKNKKGDPFFISTSEFKKLMYLNYLRVRDMDVSDMTSSEFTDYIGSKANDNVIFFPYASTRFIIGDNNLQDVGGNINYLVIGMAFAARGDKGSFTMYSASNVNMTSAIMVYNTYSAISGAVGLTNHSVGHNLDQAFLGSAQSWSQTGFRYYKENNEARKEMDKW
ncbi:toxin TcdB middle/N-terminal domain-containing protein [Rubritalea spongiae]|uniref:Toxin TcdB middle/N-terminal domain-containing protein n=1 Tax=Rubritalea spongiae TaxID=430797 RepID=A0ABW5E422_9BACT